MTESRLTIVVASKNPVKIAAALGGFERVFPSRSFEAEAISIESGVSDQPFGDAETLLGATQRARGAREQQPEADFWVGIEGGIEDSDLGMMALAWIVVLSRERCGRGRSGGFYLPNRVADLVREGMELGHANDLVFGRNNSKQNEGAIGLLTEGAMDRRELYEHAVVLALVTMRRPDLYPPES